ncbi:MAG: ester cyclase [Chloroflexi bacterium]|nr:ester cyclase [Chloroflexota bacterium]
MGDFDIVSFVRDSADTMWNGKMLGRIPDLYAPSAPIHLGEGETLRGGEELVDRAVQCLAAFPDLHLFIDDVICARRDPAYLTSVRWTTVAHNTGASVLGPATGRRVVVTGIANAVVAGGRYVEQWIELGDGELVRQLGLEERSVLQRLWPAEATSDFDEALRWGTVERANRSELAGRPADGDVRSDIGDLVMAYVDAIWNGRQIGEVERYFAPHYRERGPGSRAVFGREELQTDIISLLGAFPDLRLYVDDVFWEGDSEGGARSSTRWTLLGTNTGPSAYGPPTDAYLRLSGITNHRIDEGQFVEGWTAYSDLGLARRLAGAAPRRQSEETDEAAPWPT